MIRISIIGATGYVGLELLRLLQAHPEVEIAQLVSSGSAGENIAQSYASCAPMDFPALESFDIKTLAADSDVFFTSLPHGASQEIVSQLYGTGKIVIDMSGDFRYDDPEVYKTWYGVEHSNKNLLAQSVYGLPELHREKIKKAKLIGNPGCYTTTSILALAPLVKNKLIELDSIIIDAKSGSTGAGRKIKQDMHFCEVNESMKAYGIATHRHTSEIEQELSNIAGEDIALSFTPHLLPINRGILATCYAKLNQEISLEEVHKLYTTMYNYESFVHICKIGQLPEIKHVRGSNMASIGLALDPRTKRVIIVCCIDNLIKGAAGQAVQNMNIRFGLPEDCGLSKMAWYL